MIPKGQVDRKYKEALRDFDLAPREEQWQRLEFALRKERKRRFFWLWFRGFMVFAALSVAAGTVYWFRGEQAKPATVTAAQQVNTSADKSDHLAQKNTASIDNSGNIHKTEPDKEGLAQNSESSNRSSGRFGHTNQSRTPATNREGSLPTPSEPLPVAPGPLPVVPVHVDTSAETFNWPVLYLSPRKMALLALASPRIQEALMVNWVSGVPVLGKQPASSDPLRGLFLSAAWAGGKIENPISYVENPSKQHKDQSLLFDQLLGSYRSTAWQLGVDYRPEKGPRFSISCAIQYRKLTKDVSFDYVYRDFPIRDMDGNIVGYRQDSSGNGISFNIRQRTGVRFVGLPVYLQYPLWSDGSTELSIGGGPMLQLAVGAEGFYYDATSLRVRKLDASAFNAFSLGYQLGAAYTRHIWKPVYFTAEARYVKNPQELKMDGGSIESKLQGVQLQMGLKMKLGR